jgi:signal transduction histidine kinase
MREAVRIVSDANTVVFVVLALLTVRAWTARRDEPTLWAALAFGSLGAMILVGLGAPKIPHGRLEIERQRLDICFLVVFPYLLYRFAMAFGQRRGRFERWIGLLTVALVVATFAAPRFPAAGDPRPLWFQVYLVWFLLHWSLLSVLVSLRLWRGGRGQPHLGRRRVRALAVASALLTIAIFGLAFTTKSYSGLALAVQLLGAASAAAFLLALSPPLAVRTLWRRPEQRRVQEAIAQLMGAPTQREIVDLILPRIAEFVGARAITLRDADGTVLGSTGERERSGSVAPLAVPMTSGELLIWTTPYAPFFSADDLAAARTVGELTLLALDRARLFSQEREARVTLERANHVMTNFVALAAHELRTPVTTIAGSAETLKARAGTLPPEAERALIDALAQEGMRMRRLVEQLLDLSRLDADAIEIAPQRIPLRERVDDIVESATGDHPEAVDVEIDPALVVDADPSALERIVGNLLTNALRYGAAPIVVSAERSDNHLRLRVVDHGPGVAAEFVPDLFERFTREGRVANGVAGTGLGLAIARAYARAHHGDLLYADEPPHGASFELVLPQARRRQAPPAPGA